MILVSLLRKPCSVSVICQLTLEKIVEKEKKKKN